MPIIKLNSIDADELNWFARLTDVQLRNASEIASGIFIAESPKVIRVAIECGQSPLALLCEEKHISGDAADIIKKFPDLPVYTGSRDLLSSLTGYKLTRGVLCAMRRPILPSPEDFSKLSTICIIQGVCDTTNIGAIFRSASALGVDGIILSKDACDPLNRRAIRVSMGTVFTIPWTTCDDPVQIARKIGFKTAALALRDNSISIDDPILMNCEKLAIVLGTEGDGLPNQIIDDTDFVVKIPMYHNVDSLNVASAATIAFWELKKHR